MSTRLSNRLTVIHCDNIQCLYCGEYESYLHVTYDSSGSTWKHCQPVLRGASPTKLCWPAKAQDAMFGYSSLDALQVKTLLGTVVNVHSVVFQDPSFDRVAQYSALGRRQLCRQ